jgi:hypothetical protein
MNKAHPWRRLATSLLPCNVGAQDAVKNSGAFSCQAADVPPALRLFEFDQQSGSWPTELR